MHLHRSSLKIADESDCDLCWRSGYKGASYGTIIAASQTLDVELIMGRKGVVKSVLRLGRRARRSIAR